MKNKILGCLMLILFTSCASAQSEQGRTDSLFKQSVAFTEKGMKEEALRGFLLIISGNAPAEYKANSLIFAAGLSLDLKNYFYAEKYLTDFYTLFPEHPLLFDYYLLAARLNTVKHDGAEALKALMGAVKAAGSDSLRKYIADFTARFVQTEFDTSSFRKVISKFSGTTNEVFVTFLYASLLEQAGNQNGAKEIYLDIVSKFPATPEANLSIAALQKARTEPVAVLKQEERIIAVVLPLTTEGNLNPDAAEILNGIKFAADEYNSSRTEKVGLWIKDSQRDSSKIALIAEEIKAKKNLLAVIGPLYSNETAYLCEALAGTGLPVVSPTANSTDLAKNFSNFIQTNPTVELHARIMARYMYFVEDIKFAGVFFSNEGYSRPLAEIFKSEYESLGGKVIAENGYSVNSVNLQPFISKFSSLRAKLQGVYLPLSDRKSGEQILSAFMQDSLYVPFFGNQDWINSGALQTASRAAERFTITSENFIDPSDNDLSDFSKQYAAVMNTDLSRFTLYGYDCASMLLGLISQRESADLMTRLTAGFDISAFHNNFFIGKERINNSLNIIKFSKGQFNLVERFKLQ